MNIQLRKRHQRIWPLLFLLVAGAGFVAWDRMPENPIEDIPISCPADITGCSADHTEGRPAFVWHYQTLDNIVKISVDIKQPLKSSFTLLYLSTTETPNENSTLIGQLNEMKFYSFDVPLDLMNQNEFLVVQDQLKKKSLDVQRLNNPIP